MSGTPKANDYLEIYESRVRLAIFVAMGTIMTAGALFMTGACIGVLLGFLGPPSSTVRAFVTPILVSLMGIAGVILFGSAAIHAGVRWFGSREPVLFMTRDGFKDIRISADWIPWSAILSLKNYHGKGVVVDVDPNFLKEHLRLGANAIGASAVGHPSPLRRPRRTG